MTTTPTDAAAITEATLRLLRATTTVLERVGFLLPCEPHISVYGSTYHVVVSLFNVPLVQGAAAIERIATVLGTTVDRGDYPARRRGETGRVGWRTSTTVEGIGVEIGTEHYPVPRTRGTLPLAFGPDGQIEPTAGGALPFGWRWMVLPADAAAARAARDKHLAAAELAILSESAGMLSESAGSSS